MSTWGSIRFANSPQAIGFRRVATKIDRRTGAVWRRATRTGHPNRSEEFEKLRRAKPKLLACRCWLSADVFPADTVSRADFWQPLPKEDLSLVQQ